MKLLKAGLWFAVVSSSLLCLAQSAQAHGGHDPRLKVFISENEIRVETSLDVGVFMQFDTNKDGHLTVSEYETQYRDIAAWIDENVQLTGNNAKSVTPYFSDAPIVGRGHLQSSNKVENVKILRRYKLGVGPGDQTLNIKLYEHSPQLLYTRAGRLDDLFKFNICITAESDGNEITCRSSL